MSITNKALASYYYDAVTATVSKCKICGKNRSKTATRT